MVLIVILYALPVVFFIAAWAYHKKTNEQNPFAWRGIAMFTLVFWLIATGVLMQHLGWW